jgi:uncharacterized protein (DUF2235 family)
MGRTIVICADGTGSTFDQRVTNVTRIVSCLDLSNPDEQVVRYDAGVGTSTGRQDQVALLRNAPALRLLPARDRRGPRGWIERVAGLGFGYGLTENVFQLWSELARLDPRPDDRLFLFGFSRGAFTVRALAGLLHRCHLAHPTADLSKAFAQAWAAYQPMQPRAPDIAALRLQNRPCLVHFLGLWDTVKPYGGLKPVMLPHLRHNPDVRHVRHALSLHERRAWFKPTTWGLLDLDEDGAGRRLDPADRAAYGSQDIREVWFTGTHSDVGAGDIALRWILGEAATVPDPITLSPEGWQLLAPMDPERPAPVTASWTWTWRAIEQVPRLEINNGGLWPRLRPAWGSDGHRSPDVSQRSGQVWLHDTASSHLTLQATANRASTASRPPKLR